MISEIEKEVLSKFTPPFKFDKECGMIIDQKDVSVADIRAWGTLQYFPNAELLQDTLGEMIATAFNDKYK